MTETRHLDNAIPDFEALYEPRTAEDASMTPRMAYYLWTSAVILADTWGHPFGDHLADDCLPPIARSYAHGRWLDDFIAAFDLLADRIATGNGHTSCRTQCTAEELALHEVINTAEDFVDDDVIDPQALAHLPDHGVADNDFELMRELLFEDHDVLMLFNPAFEDYINDPALETSHLHPRNWFEPFRS